MNWYTYDTEVFAHDFIVVFKDKETGEHTVFHNDKLAVKEFISDKAYKKRCSTYRKNNCYFIGD